MHVKLHRSGPRTYLRIVEAYREASKVKHRTLATLGRLEDVDPEQVDALVNGLLRATGRAEIERGALDISALPALEFGSGWLLNELWRDLGLDRAVQKGLRSSRRTFDAEALTRVMVFNRLADPESKLGILRWLEGVRLPGIETETVTHQRLLRSLDALAGARSAIETQLEEVLLPLLDTELSLVFYDLTTIRVHGEKEQQAAEEELRRYGRSKDVQGIARQVLLGLVQKCREDPALVGGVRRQRGRGEHARADARAGAGAVSDPAGDRGGRSRAAESGQPRRASPHYALGRACAGVRAGRSDEALRRDRGAERNVVR